MICPLFMAATFSSSQIKNMTKGFKQQAQGCKKGECQWWVKDPYDRHADNCAVKMIALALTSPLNVHAKTE